MCLEREREKEREREREKERECVQNERDGTCVQREGRRMF